jgi:hypothetical protein
VPYTTRGTPAQVLEEIAASMIGGLPQLRAARTALAVER